MPTLPGTISNMEMKDYLIHRLNRDNLADLASLYSKVYNRKIQAGYYHKKFETKYTGVENAGFISYDRDNQPVASFAVIPCFIQSGDKIVLAGQAVDAMTDPGHRHKGMFMKLSGMTYDLCDELGIKLLFGFPNQESYPVMVNHLGWTETGKMSRFTIPVGSTLKQFFLKRKNYKVPGKYFSEQHGIQNSVIEDGNTGIYRSKTYMSYKSFTDNFVVKLKSADLWVKMSSDLTIGDIFLKGTKEDFFQEVKLFAKELNFKTISFQVCSNCSLHKLFSDQYQPIPSFPVLIKDLGSSLPIEKIKFNFADIDIF
jgi:Acetyltransferase (GNAT) domain